MSKAIVLDKEFNRVGEISLPNSFKGINPHNLYLYVKAYLANRRANSAIAKTRGMVRGGGRKPWSQKGRGTARAGSIRSPIWVGGGKAHGPTNERNYYQKINKKQKRLALNFALNEKGEKEALFVIDNLVVESGKTKDAFKLFQKLGVRDLLIVKEALEEKTFLAFRNIPNILMIEKNEINAYLTSVYHAVLFEKSVFENIIKEG